MVRLAVLLFISAGFLVEAFASFNDYGKIEVILREDLKDFLLPFFEKLEKFLNKESADLLSWKINPGDSKIVNTLLHKILDDDMKKVAFFEELLSIFMDMESGQEKTTIAPSTTTKAAKTKW